MKRLILGIGVVVLAVCASAQAVAAEGVRFLTLPSYDIQYELSRDSEGSSVLHTTETIVADFPDRDVNHGIERAIPRHYDGHPTSLKISSVTNEAGEKIPYSTREDNDNLVLRVGKANAYVHGRMTYVISYTQRNVTRYFDDTGRDEWYWDTNGTDWAANIETLSVSVKMSPELAAARQGEPLCYRGESGERDPCTITKDETGVYHMTTTNLGTFENASVSFGFAPHTFAGYTPSVFERFVQIWSAVQGIMAIVAFVLMIVFIIVRTRRVYRVSGQNPIVAEYIPPKDASVTIASHVVSTRTSVFTAQLIDLAVRRVISIVELKKKALFQEAVYALDVVSDVTSLRNEEKEILIDMFGGQTPAVGDRISLNKLKNDTGYRLRLLDNDRKVRRLMADQYGIKEKSPEDTHFFYGWAVILGVVGVLTLSPVMIPLIIVLVLFGFTFRRLSDKGLALRRYVLGLDKYIKASEVRRLEFLQGPDTAEKVGAPVDVTNPGQVVKLYERVLPYAVLFGREKEWTRRLGKFYEETNTQPDWFVAHGAFNAALFTSTMRSFSTSSIYASGFSANSGGSSGGGFSGGGGGGGGGGGW